MIHSQVEINGQDLILVDRDKLAWLLGVANDQLTTDIRNLSGQMTGNERLIEEFERYQQEVETCIEDLEEDTIPYLKNIVMIREGVAF